MRWLANITLALLMLGATAARADVLGRHAADAYFDPAEMAQWEKTVSHTTLATVMVAFLLAAAIGAFGLPGLV